MNKIKKTEIDLAKIEEYRKRMKRTTQFVTMNTIIYMMLRIPELMVTFIEIKKYSNYNRKIYTNIDYQKVIGFFDFLFSINSLTQFMLFYLFNSNFRKSALNLINKNE